MDRNDSVWFIFQTVSVQCRYTDICMYIYIYTAHVLFVLPNIFRLKIIHVILIRFPCCLDSISSVLCNLANRDFGFATFPHD